MIHMEHSVSLEGTEKLFGMLCEPENGASTGVVLVHGWSGYRAGPHRMFVKLSRAICRAGCICLRFDLAGRGDSAGRYDDSTLDGMIDDTLAAATFLREETGVKDIVLGGICSGGNVALGAASLDKTISGLALLSTPLFAPQKKGFGTAYGKKARTIRHYAAKACNPRTWYKAAKGLVNFRAVGKALKSNTASLNEQDSARDIMEDLRGYSGKMLFIYGSNDTESSGAPDYYRAYASDNGTDARFETVEGSDHNFYTTAWEDEAVEIICRWISGGRPDKISGSK